MIGEDGILKSLGYNETDFTVAQFSYRSIFLIVAFKYILKNALLHHNVVFYTINVTIHVIFSTSTIFHFIFAVLLRITRGQSQLLSGDATPAIHPAGGFVLSGPPSSFSSTQVSPVPRGCQL